MSIVDSHQHFWDLSKFDYPWMGDVDSGLKQNHLPGMLKPQMDEAGVDRTVIVQAVSSIDEAFWLLDLAGSAVAMDSASAQAHRLSVHSSCSEGFCSRLLSTPFVHTFSPHPHHPLTTTSPPPDLHLTTISSVHPLPPF